MSSNSNDSGKVLAETKPRQLALFQRQLSVLADDARFCLDAARDRYDEDQIYARLIPVVEAALLDSAEIFEELALTLGGFSEAELRSLDLPTVVIQLKAMVAGFLKRVEALAPDAPREDVLALTGAAAGELLREVVTFENRLASLHGLPAQLNLAEELERGLALRKLVVRFDRAVAGIATRDDRLELATKLVTNLSNSKTWKDARALDHLRMARLHDELESSGDFESIVAFANEVRKVARRTEIRQRDLAMLEQVLDRVRTESVGSHIDERFLSAAEPLRYLADGLDDLFQRGTSATYGEWKFQIEQAEDLIAESPGTQRNDTLEFQSDAET